MVEVAKEIVDNKTEGLGGDEAKVSPKEYSVVVENGVIKSASISIEGLDMFRQQVDDIMLKRVRDTDPNKIDIRLGAWNKGDSSIKLFLMSDNITETDIASFAKLIRACTM